MYFWWKLSIFLCIPYEFLIQVFIIRYSHEMVGQTGISVWSRCNAVSWFEADTLMPMRLPYFTAATIRLCPQWHRSVGTNGIYVRHTFAANTEHDVHNKQTMALPATRNAICSVLRTSANIQLNNNRVLTLALADVLHIMVLSILGGQTWIRHKRYLSFIFHVVKDFV